MICCRLSRRQSHHPRVTRIVNAVLCCAVQNWDDEDIPLLLEWVDEQLAEGILQLSSFERYKKELLAGTFNWSPLHDQVGMYVHNNVT